MRISRTGFEKRITRLEKLVEQNKLNPNDNQHRMLIGDVFLFQEFDQERSEIILNKIWGTGKLLREQNVHRKM